MSGTLEAPALTIYGTAFGETIAGQCQCGCGQPTTIATRTDNRTGERRGQHRRFVRGHNGRKPSYVVDVASGCWQWLGSTNWNGYGLAWANNRAVSAHRLIFERERGPISDGLHLDHLCNNRRCVNPDHLDPVTPKENVRRSFARGNR